MEITNEFVKKVIDETIEFDKKLEDPIFLETMKIQQKMMESIDLRTMFDEHEDTFMNMSQNVNDNILDDEIKLLEFSKRKDKEEIIESVMSS